MSRHLEMCLSMIGLNAFLQYMQLGVKCLDECSQ